MPRRLPFRPRTLPSRLAALIGLLLALLATPPASAANLVPDGEAERQLRRCIAIILAMEKPAELNRRRPIQQMCPHLPPLAELTAPLGMRLPKDGKASLAQLLDIRSALDSWHSPPPDPLDDSRLDSLLEEVLIHESPSLWEQFLEWLNGLLPQEEEEVPQWLEWLNDLDISKEQSEFIFNLSLTLLVLMALGILFNELRRLPWRREQAARRRAAKARAMDEGEELPAWSQIHTLPPRQQAATLLRHLLRLMQARELLSDPRARTAHECVTAINETLPEVRPAFEQVADAADLGLYGPAEEARPVSDALLDEAEALRRRLQEERP